MSHYARVMVDASLNSRGVIPKTEQIFDYLVPRDLGDVVQVGQLATILFGEREVKGYIVGLSDHSEMADRDVRELTGLVDEDSFLSPEDVRLSHWIADRYMCSLVQAFRLLLPPGIRQSGRSGLSTSRKLLPDVDDVKRAREQLQRAQKQREALNVALQLGKPVGRGELAKAAGCSPSTVDVLVDKQYLRWVEVRDEPRPYREMANGEDSGPHSLTPAQDEAVKQILDSSRDSDAREFLLHGVAGSGKTEVYLRVIQDALQRDGSAIFLIPEISLTPQTVSRVRGRLGDRVAVLHSAMSLSARRNEWFRLFYGEARVALGPRSVVFAPCKNLQVIIMDEEHENSYKQDHIPRYHAREVARERARLHGADLILGSATPSVESYHRAEHGRAVQLRLPQRVDARPMPDVKMVDMRRERAEGNKSVFSRRLERAIRRRLESGQQIVLFLNRRGYSSFLICGECGYTFQCPDCNVTMTYHRDRDELQCHYCGKTQPVPTKCPNCKGRKILRWGTGTQKVEAAVKSEFPGASVARMDTDSVKRRGVREKTYSRFLQGEIDILVGTQMIAKGWDIPGVTLVGVIDADTALHLPDFRSSERTFQLITQVAGRAGRGDVPGEVIVQTANPDHPALEMARHGAVDEFYKKEMRERMEVSYPPFVDLVRLLIRGERRRLVEMWAEEVHRRLVEIAATREAAVSVVGPAPAPLEKLRGAYRWHLFAKSEKWSDLSAVIREALENIQRGAEDPDIIVDVNPVQML